MKVLSIFHGNHTNSENWKRNFYLRHCCIHWHVSNLLSQHWRAILEVPIKICRHANFRASITNSRTNNVWLANTISSLELDIDSLEHFPRLVAVVLWHSWYCKLNLENVLQEIDVYIIVLFGTVWLLDIRLNKELEAFLASVVTDCLWVCTIPIVNAFLDRTM